MAKSILNLREPPRRWPLAKRLEYYSRETPSGCLQFVGNTLPNGYGRINFKGDVLYAHRAAWIAKNGPIPESHWVLHKCDNPSCVNPDHLFLGDHAANVADKVSKNRQARNHGAKGGGARLTEEQVRAIRAAAGTQKEIAAQFGVGQTTIWRVRNRQSWKTSV